MAQGSTYRMKRLLESRQLINTGPQSCGTESQHDIEHKDLLVSSKVRTFVTCWKCFKSRCVYSRYVLAPYQLKEIECLECETWYVCGSPLSPLDDATYIVREGISCSSPIEFAYYSCKRFKNICADCGSGNCSVNAELEQQYQTVLPICISSGKRPITQSENKDVALKRQQRKCRSTQPQPQGQKSPRTSKH